MKITRQVIHRFPRQSTVGNTDVEGNEKHIVFKMLRRISTDFGETSTTSF
jgi:hypothetical protein